MSEVAVVIENGFLKEKRNLKITLGQAAIVANLVCADTFFRYKYGLFH
jgi:hypothetical protein